MKDKLKTILRGLNFPDCIKIITGAVGWIMFFIPVIFSGILNLGNGAGMLFFGVLFLWGLFGNKLRENAHRKEIKALKAVLITGYIAFVSLFAVESAFMLEAISRKPSENSTLIVLGCSVYGETPSQMLTLRLDSAEEFLKENPESVAVLSGGQGENEDIPEALCMYRELTSRGIDPQRLYMESLSTNTRENIAFSAQLIKEEGLSPNIAIVTNNYHLYRATLSAEEFFEECTCISAYTPLTLLPTYIMREYLGIFAQWLQ